MKRWLPVLGVVALLAAVWLASTLPSPDVTQLPIPHTSLPDDSATTSTGPGPPIPPIQDGKLPAWVFYLMVAAVGLVVLFILGIVVLLLWSLIRSSALSNKPRLLVEKSDRQLNPRGDEAEVLAAVDAGLAELSDADTDPRRAVIACWVRLERAAAAAGTPRQIGDSPTDLVTRLLSAHRVSRAVLDGFAAVYREARYATRAIGEHDRQTAITALRHLRGELAAEIQAEIQAGAPDV